MPFFQQNTETGHTANNLMPDPEVKANMTPCNSGTACPVTQHHIPKDTNILQHCYKNIEYFSFKHYLESVFGDRITSTGTQLHFNICKEMGVQLNIKHWYDHVPKSVEISHEGKVTTLWNKCKLTKLFLKINRTS